MDKPVYVNNEVAKLLGPSLGKQGSFQSYAGTDIQAFIYLPLITLGDLGEKEVSTKSKLFAELQTISISSTRSISPVRVFGKSSPIGYTRGARTFAGTLVFASINQDVFRDIYDVAIGDGVMSSSTSLVSDQLPPFSIVIVATNEKGGAAIQIIHGITLVNYGTTYSIDDLYTEVTYSYVATDVLPLMNSSVSLARSNVPYRLDNSIYKSVSSHVEESMKAAYGTAEEMIIKSKEYYKIYDNLPIINAVNRISNI